MRRTIRSVRALALTVGAVMAVGTAAAATSASAAIVHPDCGPGVVCYEAPSG